MAPRPPAQRRFQKRRAGRAPRRPGPGMAPYEFVPLADRRPTPRAQRSAPCWRLTTSAGATRRRTPSRNSPATSLKSITPSSTAPKAATNKPALPPSHPRPRPRPPARNVAERPESGHQVDEPAKLDCHMAQATSSPAHTRQLTKYRLSCSVMPTARNGSCGADGYGRLTGRGLTQHPNRPHSLPFCRNEAAECR